MPMPKRGDDPECVIPIKYSALRSAVHTIVHDRYYLRLFLENEINMETIGVVGRGEAWIKMWYMLDWIMEDAEGYFADDIRSRLTELDPDLEDNKNLYQEAMNKAGVHDD